MSSMFRNLGSAMTFGAMETTKAKEARENYIERYGRHEEGFERYRELADEAFQKLEELWRGAQRGRQVIVETGALFADEDGNLQPGWYPEEASPLASVAGGRDNGSVPERSRNGCCRCGCPRSSVGHCGSTWQCAIRSRHRWAVPGGGSGRRHGRGCSPLCPDWDRSAGDGSRAGRGFLEVETKRARPARRHWAGYRGN